VSNYFKSKPVFTTVDMCCPPVINSYQEVSTGFLIAAKDLVVCAVTMGKM